MRTRLPVVALTIALALSACASDADDSTAADTSDTSAETTDPGTAPTHNGTAADNDEDTAVTETGLELTDTAPAGADIVIETVGTTSDRTIQRGGQAAIEQGQTFAVGADTTLTQVSFHVAAPDGVAAGQPIELAVYEVGNTVTMVPSGPVDIGAGDGPLVLTLPEAMSPDTPTHLVFSLPDVALTAGQYAVVLSFGDGGGQAEMYLQHPNGDVYPDGSAISLEGEFWKSNTNDHDSAVTITFGT